MRLRLRDARAILFSLISTVLVALVAFLFVPYRPVGVTLVLAYLLFIVTRPRMRRVIARLREVPSWRGYYRN